MRLRMVMLPGVQKPAKDSKSWQEQARADVAVALGVACFQQASRRKAIVSRFPNGAFDVTEAQPAPSEMEV